MRSSVSNVGRIFQELTSEFCLSEVRILGGAVVNLLRFLICDKKYDWRLLSQWRSQVEIIQDDKNFTGSELSGAVPSSPPFVPGKRNWPGHHRTLH